MNARFLTLCVVFLAAGQTDRAEEPGTARPSLVICVGQGGTPEYSEAFAQWGTNWQKAGAAGNAHVTLLGTDADQGGDLSKLRATLQGESPSSPEPLWLVLLGHGTYDGHEPKFNLRGDDLSASDLATLLKPFERPVIVIATFSSSGAFLAPLSKPGRIVVTATKSGGESNFSRFGKYLSEAIADPTADLDHDGQTSLLEAWISAAHQVAEFYKSEGRLSTEHSLLDDNGDGHGTPADWYSGLKLVKKSAGGSAADGRRAEQIHLVPSAAERAWPPELRAQRDALELELSRLRTTKAAIAEDEYFSKLEPLLLRLAQLYREAKLPDGGESKGL